MKALKSLNPYLNKHRKSLILGLLIIFVARLFGIIPVVYMGSTIDLIKQQIDNPLEGKSALYNALIQNTAIILGLSFVSGFLTFLQRQTIIVMSRKIEFELRNDIYKHYQKLPLIFYRNHKIGDLMNRITEDVAQVRMYLGPGIMYFINLIVLFCVVLVFMLKINTTLTLFSMLPLPFLSWIIYFVSNQINKQSKNTQQYQSKISALVHDIFSGIRVVKSFGVEHVIEKDYDNKVEEYRTASLKLAGIESFFFPLMVLLIGISYLFILYVGAQEFYHGAISVGGIIQFFLFINILIWPFTSIGWVTSIYQRAEASQQRINEFINTSTESSIDDGITPHLNGKIDIKNLSLTFSETGVKALNDINISIQPNTTIAIMGAPGSGKSTLSWTLCRMLTPNKGSIFVDGIPLSKIQTKYWRTQISMVPQDTYLFSDTIYNNILFGKKSDSHPTKNSVDYYAKMAVIHDSIMTFKDGYQTKVGERGVLLSGGQKQRIALSRALMSEPRILVMDDSLSALDNQTEHQIIQNLKNWDHPCTRIFITHRPSLAQQADQIIIMEQGRITAMGDHQTLLSQCSYYAQMFE